MIDIGTVESLHADAIAETGLHDFGTEDYLEAMTVLLTSYEAEADLTPVGRAAAHDEIVSILVARLVSEAGWKRFPEYADVAVERPVLIMGLPRTGTTTLHRMLAADPRHQGLQMWLGYEPQPRPPLPTWADHGTYRRVQDELDRFFAARPGYDGVHTKSAAAVEECWLLTRQSMACGYFAFTHHVPTFTAWLARQDMAEVYRRHRRNLQLIGLGDSRRWILKYAGHLACLDAVIAAYPDALIVRTHRAPATTVMASMCSMTAQLTAGSSTTFRGAVLAHSLLELSDEMVQRFDTDRARYPAEQFHDLDFAAFCRDPLGAVEDIYRRLGQSLADEAVAAMTVVVEEDDRVRGHRYTINDFGLTQDMVEQRLGART